MVLRQFSSQMALRFFLKFKPQFLFSFRQSTGDLFKKVWTRRGSFILRLGSRNTNLEKVCVQPLPHQDNKALNFTQIKKKFCRTNLDLFFGHLSLINPIESNLWSNNLNIFPSLSSKFLDSTESRETRPSEGVIKLSRSPPLWGHWNL